MPVLQPVSQYIRSTTQKTRVSYFVVKALFSNQDSKSSIPG